MRAKSSAPNDRAVPGILSRSIPAPGNGLGAITSTGGNVIVGAAAASDAVCAAAIAGNSTSMAARVRASPALPVPTATATHQSLAGARAAAIGTEWA